MIVPNTYEIIDGKEFDQEDDLRPEYEFAVLRETDRARGIEYQGNSVAEIEEYWADASIDEIHDRIIKWKKR